MLIIPSSLQLELGISCIHASTSVITFWPSYIYVVVLKIINRVHYQKQWAHMYKIWKSIMILHTCTYEKYSGHWWHSEQDNREHDTASNVPPSAQVCLFSSFHSTCCPWREPVLSELPTGWRIASTFSLTPHTLLLRRLETEGEKGRRAREWRGRYNIV